MSIAMLMLAFTFTANAQKEKKSPAKSSSATIDGVTVTVNYSSPSVRGRTIWGDLVPYDKIWRTGANEATTISFDKDVKINGTTVKAGTYSLFTIPGKEKWTIIINTEAKQWGAYKYDEKLDVMRFTVTPEKSKEMQESLEIEVDEDGEISIEWEHLEVEFKIAKA